MVREKDGNLSNTTKEVAGRGGAGKGGCAIRNLGGKRGAGMHHETRRRKSF